MIKSFRNILDDKGFYKKTTGPYFPLHLHLIALVLIFSMLQKIKDGVSWVEMITLLAAFATMVSQFGVELNLNQGKIRHYISILGIRFGKYRVYGNPEYLVLIHNKKYLRLFKYVGRFALFIYNPYTLNLVYGNNRTKLKSVFIGRYYKQSIAVQIGLNLSVTMQIGLLDDLSGSPKWIRNIL